MKNARISLRCVAFVWLAMTFIYSVPSLASEVLFKAKTADNTLVVTRLEDRAKCDFSMNCIKVTLNNNRVHEGYGTRFELNAAYPNSKKPVIIILSTDTGGNSIVSTTTLIDLGKKGGEARSFVYNHAGEIEVTALSKTQFELIGLFEKDDLGDPAISSFVYDRTTGYIFTKPPSGRMDYSGFIGRFPADLLSDKEARADIVKALGTDYFLKVREFSGTANPFEADDSEAIKWAVSKGCKSHFCSGYETLTLLNIKDAKAVIVLLETIANKPIFSLWSTDEMTSNDLQEIAYSMQSWLRERGASFEPSMGFRIFNSVIAENDGVSHLQKPEAPKNADIVSTGSAFLIASSGHLVTNDHVANSCKSLSVHHPSGFSAPGTLIASDTENDLALVKFDPPEQLQTAKMRFDDIKTGEDIVVFGYPLSDILSAAGNVVVGNLTALAGLGNDERMFQISAPVQPGNSGGPVLDRSGNVIGVVVSRLREEAGQPQNVNFAIKGTVTKQFLIGLNIPFETAEKGEALQTPDIAELAKSFTYKIVCSSR